MEQMQQEQPQSQNFFKYQQKLGQSTSVTSLTAHTLNIQLPTGLYGKNDNYNILLYNGVEIPEKAVVANTVLSRAVIIGDKRALSTTKTIFSNISFISDQVNMQASTITQHVHNQLYFYDNQIKTANEQKLFFGANVAASFVQNLEFDPLVYHHFGNKGYSNATGTIQNDLDFKGAAAGDALRAIAINAMFTTISIPFYQLLPGLFELQDKIFLSNASLSLQIDNNYQIDAYVQTRGYLANGVQTINDYTQVFFKFVPGQQIFVQSIQNVSMELQYQIPFKYRILQAQGDLKSETIKLSARNVKFLSFMIIRKDLTANLSNGKIMQNLFELNNDANKVILNNLSFDSSKNFVYVQPNIATMRQPSQQIALENIAGVRLGFPHLSFFSFEEIDLLEFNLSVNILEKTGENDYMYYIYYITVE